MTHVTTPFMLSHLNCYCTVRPILSILQFTRCTLYGTLYTCYLICAIELNVPPAVISYYVLHTCVHVFFKALFTLCIADIVMSALRTMREPLDR